MRIAILSDIHANLEALTAVLEDATRIGYDRLACLGDIVGYGANPNECVEIIRELAYRDGMGQWVVLGNHDDAAVGGDISQFNGMARESALWTRRAITSTSRQFLQSLPIDRNLESLYLVHATPDNPHSWEYVHGLVSSHEAMLSYHQSMAFIGHTHYPVAYIWNMKQRDITLNLDPVVGVKSDYRYLINVGSVGQPRDGDPRASYVILDMEKQEIERRRVEYDIKTTDAKIVKAGLPPFHGQRLYFGQ